MIICLKLLLFFVLEMKFSERCKSKSAAVDGVRILVINTGGTASMVKRNGIYMPEKGAIVNVISQIPAHFTRKLDGDENEFYFNDLNEDVSFVVKETETLIDSSNLVPQNWLEILKMIDENSDFDAFIVVHGTDTLAYTAAALSFMLESFNKTVILTGAMVAFVEKHSDFQSNLINSLLIAAKHVISKPTVFFDKHLFIATRIKKKSTSSLDAFYSPNAKPLENLCYNSNNPICEFDSLTKPGISMKVCKKIRIIKIYPGIDSLFFDSINFNNTKGLILETFGTGNIPSQQRVIDSIKRIVDSGTVVVNVTQIEMGRVQNIYEGSKFLHDFGVLSGEDMTLEAAYAKLAYLLGNFDDVEEVKRLFKKPLKAEFTPN